MKFRSIFILFNIVLVVSFLFIFLMPAFVVGPEVLGDFLARAWPLAILFVAVLALLNGFFLANRKVFTLVEKEDWSGLSAYLVELVFVKRRYRQQHVRLLVNAYLLQSDVAGIRRLREELESRDRASVARNATLFAPAFLLQRDLEGALAFVRSYEEDPSVQDRAWLSFYGGLAAAYSGDLAESSSRLKAAAASSDAVLAALACHVLDSSCKEADLGDLTKAKKAELRRKFPRERWFKEVDRAKGEVHVMVLSKLIDDATSWLFA
jgi:hypothetical protein